MPMIDPATERDFEAIAVLNAAAFREFADRLSPEGWGAMEARVRDVASRAASSRFLIARDQHGIVGSVGYCPPGKSEPHVFPAGWAALFLLAVAPTHRARGIARALVTRCIESARADAAPALGLFTCELMIPAQHLYEAMGFHRDRELPPKYGVRYWLYRLDLR